MEMLKHISTAVAAIIIVLNYSACAPVAGNTTTSALPRLNEGQSVFFGYIEPITHAWVPDEHNADRFNAVRLAHHGGLLGPLVKTVKPATVTLTFLNLESHRTYGTELDESDDGQSLFAIALPRGSYSLTISHFYKVSSHMAITSPGNGEAVYIGDLSIWHSDGLDWLNCEYDAGSIKKFISRYPRFQDSIIDRATACGSKPPLSSPLIGKWQIEDADSDEVLEFFEDGSIREIEKGATMQGIYKFLRENVLWVDFRVSGASLPPLVELFTINDDSLLLEKGREQFRYRKVSPTK